MENLQSTDEIKRAFEGIKLPELDVSDLVVNSIRNAKYQHYLPRKRRAFVIGLSAAILFLSATAFAVANIWRLNDENNNTILQYMPFNEQNQKPFDSSTDLEYQNLINSLAPGKSITYYDARQPKPKGSNVSAVISSYSKPVKYTDLDMLRAKFGISFATPSQLPEGYIFTEGDLTFEPVPPNDDTFNKLKEEVKTSGKNIVAVECETSSKASSVSMAYKNTDKEFMLYVNIFEGKNLYTDELQNSIVENMLLNGREILYIEKDSARKIIMREALPDRQRTVETFEAGKALNKGTNSYIHYTISSKDLSKEELLDIAQSMIH